MCVGGVVLLCFGHGDKIFEKQLKEGKVYLGSQFQFMVVGWTFQPLMRHNMAAEACDRGDNSPRKQREKPEGEAVVKYKEAKGMPWRPMP